MNPECLSVIFPLKHEITGHVEVNESEEAKKQQGQQKGEGRLMQQVGNPLKILH